MNMVAIFTFLGTGWVWHRNEDSDYWDQNAEWMAWKVYRATEVSGRRTALALNFVLAPQSLKDGISTTGVEEWQWNTDPRITVAVVIRLARLLLWLSSYRSVSSTISSDMISCKNLLILGIYRSPSQAHLNDIWSMDISKRTELSGKTHLRVWSLQFHHLLIQVSG